jgi:hypothetical protein
MENDSLPSQRKFQNDTAHNNHKTAGNGKRGRTKRKEESESERENASRHDPKGSKEEKAEQNKKESIENTEKRH